MEGWRVEQHQKEKFVRYDVKCEVGGHAKPMFGFVLQKECKGIMELNMISYTIVKFQLDEVNEHV